MQGDRSLSSHRSIGTHDVDLNRITADHSHDRHSSDSDDSLRNDTSAHQSRRRSNPVVATYRQFNPGDGDMAIEELANVSRGA